ncbi:hypothetical protein BCR42DRAFT_494772 [Absidia repens]|uniref:RNA polymerase II-associated protein 1 C-terminal domain-containing protein n=1 Tax=Absidia repens TaxID=90262 RepID=A0A1X2I5F3_9FUNG|nr:hypothetical protein BCR42DRAFT_494772 [Absidia repens]
MNRSNIRSNPAHYDRDEDLEQLQREFMNSNEVSSASVSRKAPPSFGSGSKKPSLFAQRRAAAAAAATATTTTARSPSEKKSGITIADLANEGSSSGVAMPGLESASSNMPGLEETSAMPGLSSTTVEDHPNDQGDSAISYEPVVDPNPEPHIPATKKMLDLTSMLGSILGQVTEHSVENVTAPTLTAQHQGFPQPTHRSVFRKHQQQQQQKMEMTTSPASTAVSDNADDESQSKHQHDYQNENDQRIAAMTDDEIQAARDEILGSLSQDSIAYLNQLQGKRAKPLSDIPQQKQQSPRSGETAGNDYTDGAAAGDDDLWAMKNKYFADVPLEGDKLAWIDDRFKAHMDNNKSKEDGAAAGDGEKEDGNVDPVYRQLRFDLQGRVVDPNDVNRARQQELHHHGDQPDQAGYTLAELFYLVRSQVPSQRALILNILTRILEHAKKDPLQKDNKAIIQVFRRRDVAAAVYFRSALDDRHLVVVISAIQALLALATVDRLEDESSSLVTFNTWLGHISQPLLAAPQETTKKWVNKMKSATMGGGHDQQGTDDDAGLAERDMLDALTQMDIFARLRYLMAVDSDVRVSDSTSMERMVELLTCMAELKGEAICEAILANGVFDLALGWVDDQQQHNMDVGSSPEHRLRVLRLVTAVIRGSKKAAMDVKDAVTLLTLPWLATSAATHGDYQVQIESLKILRLLACYGIVVPTLQDLQDTVMQWLAAAINSNKKALDMGDTTRVDNNNRAATVIGLLEVLLHAAADPHKTTPAHAINWHQPSSFLPLITTLLDTTTASMAIGKTKNEMLHGTCLGYLSTWTSYLDKFPPESMDTLKQVWDVMQQQQMNQDQKENTNLSSHWILRYMQLWLYFTKLDGNKTIATPWITASMMEQSRAYWKSLGYLVQQALTHNDFYGRMVYYLWHRIMDSNEELETDGLNAERGDVDDATMGMVVNSLHAGVVETWLARALLRMCVLSCLDKDNTELANELEPFYLNQGNDNDRDEGETRDVRLSKQLMELDGQDISTLCYPRKTGPDAASSVDAWLLSPVDEIYYWDKSQVTQHLLQQQLHDSTEIQSQQQQRGPITTVTNVVINTLQAVWQLHLHHLDHSLLLVSLMKIFLVGDREGQSLMVDGAAAIREIFWDEALATQMDRWMNVLEDQDNKKPLITGLTSLEQAWLTSSDYTRQAHVPFYQFYQAFLSQYASVSLGHRVYSRVLAFVAKKVSDQVDYRHLLLSDYQDILTTLKRQGYSLDLATPSMEQKTNVV